MARIDFEDLRGTLEDCIAFTQAGDVMGLVDYVRGLTPELGSVFIAHHIEDAAMPGTFAEAVFNILAA